MTIRESSDGTTVVDTDYYWRPIETCPQGRKVQLINRIAGVAVYGTYTQKYKYWTHWAPLPKFADAYTTICSQPDKTEEEMAK